VQLTAPNFPKAVQHKYQRLRSSKAAHLIHGFPVKVIEQTAKPQRKSIFDLLFGRPLSSEEDSVERVGPVEGVPVFGLDALSSAAYGPEAALTILIPLGLVGLAYIIPISLTIIVLLSIVYFSYRQTIAAYPTGGGSYTVATQNLGARAGLLAGAALMIDYILNVAVGISAGVGALVSALPDLQSHVLALCLGILLLLTVVNLRGVRETGLVFMAPTYLFVACLGGVILLGLWKTIQHGGHPIPVAPPPPLPPAVAAVSLWLLIKAFASGCTAMTGVEAVSNGVQAFREPRVKSAQKTLTLIIAILILLLAGIAYLCRAYGIGATPPGQPGYQSVLSQLTAAVAGRHTVYFVTIGAILTVLSLSANTSFADFPRLCHAIAENGYLPYLFTIRGRRLVFSFGVCALAIVTGLLLIAFKGVTDRLIPLFAVGAFTAFTLSQAGMVMHWKRSGGTGARTSMFINGLGAVSTGVTLCVVIVAKFTEGAWITVIAIPGLIMLMTCVRRHYDMIEEETALRRSANLKDISRPIVVLPLQRWSRVAEKALRFAYVLSRDLWVLHIQGEGEPNQPAADALINSFEEYIEKPALQAGYTPPELVVLRSPYRFVITTIFQYILEVERKHPDRQIAVLVPELIERRWYYHFLHNQRANALKLMLYLKGNRRIIVINVPWYLQ
jgi:amino acid transporter